VPDPVLLFRYSALTMNGHRIHYDAPYAREVEGYPGLVVHGPLTATMMLEALAREVGGRVARFAFRAVQPVFAGEAMAFCGRRTEGAAFDLWAENGRGEACMTGEARVDP
jgi:3-methylfumaryl-CoA hydratase